MIGIKEKLYLVIYAVKQDTTSYNFGATVASYDYLPKPLINLTDNSCSSTKCPPWFRYSNQHRLSKFSHIPCTSDQTRSESAVTWDQRPASRIPLNPAGIPDPEITGFKFPGHDTLLMMYY